MHSAVTGLIVLLVSAGMAPVLAAERLPDRRAVKEPFKGAAASAANENLLDLLRQLETLQEEVKQLRNASEVQGHELEQLKSRQRALYDDLDKRLREAERSGVAAPASAAAPPAGASAGPAGPGSAARTTTADQQKEYDAAFALMKQGLYARAIQAFRDFLARHPDSGLADNAQYWVAEGNYVLRNYKLALEEFTKVLTYAQSPKAADAQLKIGYVYYEMAAYDKARKALTEVQGRYPGTGVARLAATRLDKMKSEGR